MRAIIIAGLALAVLGGVALAQVAGVTTLRGGIGLTEVNPPPPTVEQAKPPHGFPRAYRQQPPLIPHRVDGYQVTREFNKCLSCHGWPQHAQYGAPKVSETHYETREGKRVDEVAGSRWFCTQCHVPQADAPPLVPNAFRSAKEIGGAFD